MTILKQSVSKKTLESPINKGCQPLDIRYKNKLKKSQKNNVQKNVPENMLEKMLNKMLDNIPG